MNTAEQCSAHPYHNAFDAARRNEQIKRLAKGPQDAHTWKVVVKPQCGPDFAPTHFSVHDGVLWAYDTDGDGWIVANHYLACGFKPQQTCPDCESPYDPCDCGTDN